MSYQDRLREELKQLEERCNKLAAFMDTETYEGMSDVDQILLGAQGMAMTNYAHLLGERVDRLTDDAGE